MPAKTGFWVTDDGTPLGRTVVEKLFALGYRATLVRFKDLSKLHPPASLGGLVILAPVREIGKDGLWDAASEHFLKDAFRMARLAAPRLRKTGRKSGAVFMTVSRMDGAFGLGEESGGGIRSAVPGSAMSSSREGGRWDPISGGLAGLAKSAGHEWAEVRCRALDVAWDWADHEKIASAIVEELSHPEPVELGLSPEGRVALRLEERPLSDLDQPAPLEPGDVVLVTGGARGIAAEAAAALVEAFEPTLVLLDRPPAPQAEPEWLRPLEDESSIREAISEQLGGSAAGPGAVEEEFLRWKTNRETARSLSHLEALGSRVLYRSADILSEESVAEALEAIREEAGPIRGLIHGAGLPAEVLLEDEVPARFDAVFDTRVRGLRSLLKALAHDDLRFISLFASSAGRYGRAGESDEAAASEVLNKAARSLAASRPGCRVVSIGWGPWDAGALPRQARREYEAEGVPVIPPGTGGRHLIAEILQSPGLDPEVVVAARVTGRPAHERAGAGQREFETVFKRRVGLESHPFLASHVIDGRFVLPTPVLLEWLWQAAVQGHPELRFHGFDSLRAHERVAFKEGEDRHFRVSAAKAVKTGPLTRVPVEIRDERGRLVAEISVLLAKHLPRFTGKPSRPAVGEAAGTGGQGGGDIYGGLLAHGPELRGIESIEGCSADGISARVKTAPEPSAWMREPAGDRWLADPLALDAGLQLLVLWSFGIYGDGSSTCSIRRYRQYREAFPEEGLRVDVRVAREGEHAAADLDFLDGEGALVARMEGFECAAGAIHPGDTLKLVRA